MDEISSSEFRKRYASFRKPIAVTVNGHVIGQWIPANSATYVMARTDNGQEVFGLEPPSGATTRTPAASDPIFRGGTEPSAFNSRPFTPAPKGK